MEDIVSLKQKWEQFKVGHPKVRIRDAAEQLNTTEAELVAASVGDGVVRLQNDFPQILQALEPLGKVMALTRNAYCVHERKGVYTNLTFTGTMGLAVSPDIDLRLFLSVWAYGFAVEENGRKSLQFFGKDGHAVHKVYLTVESDANAYDLLLARFSAGQELEALELSQQQAPAPERADMEIDVSGFREHWLMLKDTHDFHSLLKKFGVSRTQGLRLAPGGYTVRLNSGALNRFLHEVSERNLDVMVFTANPGCIQIHTGKVKNLLHTGAWFNVLDPDFNLHLRADAIASVWLVKKPTADGIVTSIEVFDHYGNVIVQFFGKRKPGIPENGAWRSLTAELTEEN